MNEKFIIAIIIIIILLIIIFAATNNNCNDDSNNKSNNNSKIKTKSNKIAGRSKVLEKLEVLSHTNEYISSSSHVVKNIEERSDSSIDDKPLVESIRVEVPFTKCSTCPDPCPTCPTCPACPPQEIPTGCLQGIGGNCVVNTDCVGGLSCVDTICVCVKPDPPTIGNITYQDGISTITWTASPGASSYNIFLFGPSPQTQLFYTGLSIQFALIEGFYSVLIYPVSSGCGEGLPAHGQFTIGLCQSDANCPDHLFCNQTTGLCSSCLDSSNCPPGQQCFNGSCVNCTDSSQCQNGLICAGFECTNCTTNSECPINHACINGVCTPPQCLFNTDCTNPSTPFCNTNTFTCTQCITTSNCPTGNVCVNGSCHVCQQNSDCPVDYTCSNGQCVPPECIVDSQCINPAKPHCSPSTLKCVQCNNATQCPIGNTCVQGLCNGCQLSSQCPTNYTCVTGTCVPPQCTADVDCTTPGKPHCNSTTLTCVQCNQTTDCPTGNSCLNNVCVPCQTNSQCPPGDKCVSGECLPPQCTTSSDCTNPGFLHCNTTTQQCVPCLVSGDCPTANTCNSNNQCVPPQCLSDANCNVSLPRCDLFNFTCVECLTGGDCGGPPNVCIAGNTCCTLIPPNITSATGLNDVNSTISVNFTSVVPFADITCVFTISVSPGVTIYTSPPLTGLTGTYILSESNTGVPLYPNTGYTIGLQYQQPCGNTTFTFRSMTMPTSGVTTINNGFFSNPTNINTGMIVQDLSGPFCNTPGCTFVVKGKVLLSQTPAFHPNLATAVRSNLSPIAGTNTCIANTECLADFLAPWSPIVPVTGQTWYGIIMADKGFYTIPSTSDPSSAVPFVA